MSTARGFDRTDVARCWAGFASLGTGLIHIAVVRETFAATWAHGIFFAVVGLTQVGWALWALSRSRVPLPRLTAAATLAMIALWAVSRTVGLSLDPLTSIPLPVGTADLLAVVLEVALLLCILAAIPRPAALQAEPDVDHDASAAASSARFVALLFAGALAVSAIATPAMAATSAGDYASEHGH